jgi:hypothetical protein
MNMHKICPILDRGIQRKIRCIRSFDLLSSIAMLFLLEIFIELLRLFF